MKNQSIRSYVATLAQQIRKSGQTFSTAMKTAWKIAKLKFSTVANFEFAKQETCEVRTATGSILDYYTSKNNEVVIRFKDTEKDALRSFRAINLI